MRSQGEATGRFQCAVCEANVLRGAQEECEQVLERAYAISTTPDRRLLDLLRQATGMDVGRIGAWYDQRRRSGHPGAAAALPPPNPSGAPQHLGGAWRPSRISLLPPATDAQAPRRRPGRALA
jgi:hypothetical protein